MTLRSCQCCHSAWHNAFLARVPVQGRLRLLCPPRRFIGRPTVAEVSRSLLQYIQMVIGIITVRLVKTSKRTYARYMLTKKLFWTLSPNYSFLLANSPTRDRAASFSGFLDHTVTYKRRYDFSGRGIGPSQRLLPDNTQDSQEIDIYAPSGIRTLNPS
jgi:hypothetical protein